MVTTSRLTACSERPLEVEKVVIPNTVHPSEAKHDNLSICFVSLLVTPSRGHDATLHYELGTPSFWLLWPPHSGHEKCECLYLWGLGLHVSVLVVFLYGFKCMCVYGVLLVEVWWLVSWVWFGYRGRRAAPWLMFRFKTRWGKDEPWF